MSIVLKSPTREKLDSKLQKLAKLQADIKRLENADKTAARKLESRRKIVLGGCLIKAEREGRITENWIQNLVNTYASERDKPIFDFAKSESENDANDSVAIAKQE